MNSYELAPSCVIHERRAIQRTFRHLLNFGAPGCGKGTQGAVIANIPRFHYFACGDAFRSLDTRSEIGQRFVDHSSRGELVPDSLTVDLWKSQIDARITTSDYKPDIDFLWLDGIPRNVEQAKLLEPFCNILKVFHLSCPDRDELARRIRKRALKQNRLDDANEDIIRSRFRTYEEESKPILAHYGADMVTDIDASQPPVKVLSDILDEIMKTDSWQELATQVI